MAKAKPSKKAEKKYVSPWKTTKDNLGYFAESYHKPGWNPPFDFSKVKERTANRPGQGAGWLTKKEVKDQRKEIKSG